jgi:hypothetical protein
MYQAVCRECFTSPIKKSPRKSPHKIQKTILKAPSNKSETPTILGEKSMQQIQNAANRQLFISSPPRI